MVSTCTSPLSAGDTSTEDFEIIQQISPSPYAISPNENIDVGNISPGLDLSLSKCDELTVASAVACDKAKVRQQSAMLDKWLGCNGGNLYPCREEKEKLAVQMKMTYIQVNRWFANRRRKQTKRTKVVNSPVNSLTPSAPQTSPVGIATAPLHPIRSSTPNTLIEQQQQQHHQLLLAAAATATAAAAAASSNERVPSPLNKENVLQNLSPEMITLLTQSLSAQQGSGAQDEKADMVVNQQQQRESAATPPAIDQLQQGLYQQQLLNDPRASLSSPFYNSPDNIKLLNALQSQSQAAQYNPLLLMSLLQQTQPFLTQQQVAQMVLQLQAQALQHQIMQHNLAQQILVAHAQQQQVPSSTPQVWNAGSISASPIGLASDSEVSELSELSPRPRCMDRPHSPPFKDPHQLADQSLLRLLNFSQLSEKEQLAVNVLANFSSECR